jgi:tRNA U34 5-methylaminomethyl-2-thiouridine-forming methyltransferase MnmC
MAAEPVVIITGDGSPTLYLPELNEHYRSTYGAMQESRFVFIENALKRMKKQTVSLFELGFGTGLNALLSCIEAENQKKCIIYDSIDKFPVKKQIWQELAGFLDEKTGGLYRSINESGWEFPVEITNHFSLRKIKSDIETYCPDKTYDVVYFDAFSPGVQPELWTTDIFNKIANMMEPGAVLATYSSRGQVKRNMIASGLRAETIPGPPGKREMIVAIKS